MDWPFETFIPQPPRRVSGFAEIVGNSHGGWHIGQIYVGPQFRQADRDERKQIEMSLHTLAGGAIGRAYRKTMEGERREHH